MLPYSALLAGANETEFRIGILNSRLFGFREVREAYGEIFALVHLTGSVLAAGADCLSSVPGRMDAAPPVPDCRNCCGRRARLDRFGYYPPGAAAAQNLKRNTELGSTWEHEF